MWNKLADGRFRIDAAKQVLSEFIATAPDKEDLHIGLRLYGSRVSYHDKGACEDSVLLVPIEGFHRKEMLKIVKDARALGATPLARSLNAAADDLTRPGKKQVIVFTDGEESCDGDVRAALARLTADGVNADVRIIGIGLPKAAAERFAQMVPSVNTDTAKGLAQALKEATTTIAPAEPPKQKKQTLTVKLTKDSKPWTEGGVTVTDTLGKAVTLSKGKEPGAWAGEVAPGMYQATVKPSGRVFPSLGVAVGEEALYVLDVSESPKVTLEVPPGPISTLQDISVSYAGASDADGQYVILAPVGAPDDAQPVYTRAPGKEGKAIIKTLVDPGRFEARFIAAVGSEVVVCGRSKPFETIQPAASLEMSAKVTASSQVQVTFKSTPQDGDWIGWAKAGAPDGEYGNWTRLTEGSDKVTVVSPVEVGDYEMRYCNDNTPKPRARFAFKVEAAAMKIDAPDSVMGGSKVAIAWAAPAAGGVYLTVVPKGAADNAYTEWMYLTADQMNPLRLQTPREVGDFEIHMYMEDAGKLLMRRALTLTKM